MLIKKIPTKMGKNNKKHFDSEIHDPVGLENNIYEFLEKNLDSPSFEKLGYISKKEKIAELMRQYLETKEYKYFVT